MHTQPAIRLRTSPRRSGFAVLLNANAKQVTEELRRALEVVVPPRDLFFSRTAREASAIAETVLDRSYETVFTGGGDGTFVGWVNAILEGAARRNVAAPRFGVLALGTGNAVAEVVGARSDAHVEELAAFASGETRARRLDLLTCEGRRTPFAGVGVDAAVLNDYNWLKQRFGDTALRPLVCGIPGYGLAIALRSAPRHLLARKPTHCEIVNAGGPAYRLDGRGRQIGPAVGHGELLYAGPCTMAAASTVPFYGFALRAFPFAHARPGMMQLRLATALPLANILCNLPSVWSGAFDHPALLDFHAERVTVDFERPMPLQVGGDAEGWRDQVTFDMAPSPIEIVDYTARARRPHLLN